MNFMQLHLWTTHQSDRDAGAELAVNVQQATGQLVKEDNLIIEE